MQLRSDYNIYILMVNGFKEITPDLTRSLIDKAERSPRLRSHHNFHDGPECPVQRLCIGLSPGTYVRPHQHPQRNKWETILILSGEVCILCFDDNGLVNGRSHLGSDPLLSKGIELPAGSWHTIFPVGGAALVLEFKEGPFGEKAPVEFASWSPEEGQPVVQSFLDWAAKAQIGDRFTPN